MPRRQAVPTEREELLPAALPVPQELHSQPASPSLQGGQRHAPSFRWKKNCRPSRRIQTAATIWRRQRSCPFGTARTVRQRATRFRQIPLVDGGLAALALEIRLFHEFDFSPAHGASALRFNRSLRPLNPDQCQSSKHRVVTANKGDPNHEVTRKGPNMASWSEGKVRFCSACRPLGAAAGVAAGQSGSCRLKFLWTVNLGAGLGAVSGAQRAPHSPPAEPANPEHAPITVRWHNRQQLQRKLRRRRPTILRRTDIPGAASRLQRPALQPPLSGRDAEWNGFSSQRVCC